MKCINCNISQSCSYAYGKLCRPPCAAEELETIDKQTTAVSEWNRQPKNNETGANIFPTTEGKIGRDQK